MLGSIHDYDITIAYLKSMDKNGNYDARNVIMQRNNLYNQFVKYCNIYLSLS